MTATSEPQQQAPEPTPIGQDEQREQGEPETCPHGYWNQNSKGECGVPGCITFDQDGNRRPTPQQPPDLMEALRASIEAARNPAPQQPPPQEQDTDQEPTAADSGALASDRRQGAARTANPVMVHHPERSVPAPVYEAEDAGDRALRTEVKNACVAYLDAIGDYADRGNLDADLAELWSYIEPALAVARPATDQRLIDVLAELAVMENAPIAGKDPGLLLALWADLIRRALFGGVQ